MDSCCVCYNEQIAENVLDSYFKDFISLSKKVIYPTYPNSFCGSVELVDENKDPIRFRTFSFHSKKYKQKDCAVFWAIKALLELQEVLFIDCVIIVRVIPNVVCNIDYFSKDYKYWVSRFRIDWAKI